jgi:AAA family ATP:ADP antiporter
LFLVMSSYMAARIARDAIFLGDFGAIDLAYVDLASALLIGIVIAGYLTVARHVKLPVLLIGSLLFYALNLVVLWYLAESHEPRWLSPVIYVWVSLFGALAPVQVWTLANYVLTTREAKRVFGLVGSGAILGAVFGAKGTSILAKQFGAESLLLVVALAMIACAGLVGPIWRRREAILGSHGPDTPSRVHVIESLRVIGRAPYLRAIALLILTANITTSLAGWQFKALAKGFYPQKDALAVFFGDFYFWAGLAGFVVQLAVTGRLLRKFGLGPAMLVVPIAFVFGSTAVLLWGTVTIWAAIALRSCINVLQYSIDKPSVELLYLPISASVKNQVKSFIDTVVWRFGDGLAAVAVLGFGKALGWPAPRVSWVVLALVVAWVTTVIVARRRYVDTLRASIAEHRLDAERASAPVIDRLTSNVLLERLKSSTPQDVLYALDLFEMGRHGAAHPAIRGLLDHPDASVRRKAIEVLNESRDTSAAALVESRLEDPDLGVRTEAMLYLARHAHFDPLSRVEQRGQFDDFSIRSAVVAYLARPGRAQNLDVARLMLEGLVNEPGPDGARSRIEAARILALAPGKFEDVHQRLLADSDPEVVREAIGAVPGRPPVALVPDLLALAGRADVGAAAADALARLGDTLVPMLRARLADASLPVATRQGIPAVLARIGTRDAIHAINEAVVDGDAAVRFRAISALNKLQRAEADLESDPQLLETVLIAEIMGHYRSYQIVGVMGPAADQSDAVLRQLRESMQREVERIFRLLSLLHPHDDLHSAYYGAQSANPIVHDNAIEFLDNVLDKPMRRLLVPLLDSAFSAADRSRLAGEILGLAGQSPAETVAALLRSDDLWLKCCGVYAVGATGLREFEDELDRCLDDPDPLLREAALQARARL